MSLAMAGMVMAYLLGWGSGRVAGAMREGVARRVAKFDARDVVVVFGRPGDRR